MRENTHKDQRVAQVFIVFLGKVTVVLVSFAFELVVEVVAGAVGRSGVWKKSFQRFEHSVLQTRKDKRGHKLGGGGKGSVERTLSG